MGIGEGVGIGEALGLQFRQGCKTNLILDEEAGGKKINYVVKVQI